MPIVIQKPRVTEADAAFIDADDHEYAVYAGHIRGGPGAAWLGAFEEALLTVEGAREVRVGPDSYGFVCLDERARAVLGGLLCAKERSDEVDGDGAGQSPAESTVNSEAAGEPGGPPELVRKYSALADEVFGPHDDTV